MSSPFWRHPANTQVAQVTKRTVTTTTNGHTYTVTITDDNGDTAAVTYTVANPPDTTVTLVAAGLVAAWNASLNPLVSKFTATQNAGELILTADAAGRPFALSFSGTGTWSGSGNSTEPVSNTDYGQASNWSTDAVPTTNDNVTLSGGNVDLLYGLNQSSAAIGSFVVSEAFSAKVGRFEDGKGHYLRIDPNSFAYRGRSPRALFDIGSANIDMLVEGSGTPDLAGRNAVVVKGSNIDELTINSGNVGVATANSDDTATVSKINIGQVGSVPPVVDVGSGVTLTTLKAQAGKVDVRCAATTVTAGAGSTVTTSGSGAITTLNVATGGTAYPCSSGAVTSLHNWGYVDLTKDKTPRTITDYYPYPGSVLIYGSHITFTNGFHPVSSGVDGSAQVIFKA